VSTVLELDEKKFWIALFSVMAKREAANANAIDQAFVPLFFVVSKRHDSKRDIRKGNPPNAATSFLEL
jgi:hypothetical protein